ncbi:rhodanese-like domain-containing protein [Marinifilum caeruleilacunae]|uniref:Rhodanese-like domain-containing protein n=1 Tax=Marinifilum caeruleilacunae TaxID=2499076 RepID=A0ABX1WTJ8_9BACT|nr:rhodanese-like domain-containing protein [Marinifilum caeruleilacunae]NOU59296.1 rhodanese-like domain-containing protein [Marinifilum caeruleilacunae]
MRILYFTFLLFLLAACSNFNKSKEQDSQNIGSNSGSEESMEDYSQYRDITGLVDAKEFHRLIVNCDSVLIYDIRPRDVYISEPRIKGGKLIYDFTYFKEALKDLHRDHQIMVYCGMELRSPAAVKALVKQGFNNVYELQGGLSVWKQLKLPLVDTQGNAYEYPEKE